MAATNMLVVGDDRSDGSTVGKDANSLVGFHGSACAQAAAMTTQLTTLTPADAEGTPDYSTASITSSSPFGFASAQEAITVLYVIKNLQVRLAEVEAMLEEKGICAAN